MSGFFCSVAAATEQLKDTVNKLMTGSTDLNTLVGTIQKVREHEIQSPLLFSPFTQCSTVHAFAIHCIVVFSGNRGAPVS